MTANQVNIYPSGHIEMAASIPLIVNPASGKGDSFQVAKKVKELLSGYEVRIIQTKDEADSARVGREIASENPDSLIIVGGDGTVNSVCQSFIDHPETKILVVPAGTGSDLARCFNITSVEGAVKALSGRKTTAIDAVMCHTGNGNRLFMNILEVGYGAEVMKRVNSVKNRTKRTFFTSSIREVFRLKSHSLTLEGDFGKIDIRTPEIVIANGRYFGGGMKASINSSLSDGILDLHIIREIRKLELLLKLNKLVKGTYVTDPAVTNLQTSKLSITGDSAPMEADGENFGNVPVELEVLNKSFTFYHL